MSSETSSTTTKPRYNDPWTKSVNQLTYIKTALSKKYPDAAAIVTRVENSFGVNPGTTLGAAESFAISLAEASKAEREKSTTASTGTQTGFGSGSTSTGTQTHGR
ncbi:hypothetical protein I302_107166 [Kwoniella bestiolae CBS 10118]|uniref:Uncharacterized protein n=1 Tax=Kwoniella bestiolae CBS 10118 TaxID=1296100 RepID=A0A1B9FZB9_9TREE|nr:hypothetical protein I302_05568 [Kwoniella bestiolae CBS 10118]OCF24110.1 hypothetical protein I302_05568 [Kwoniella bestiolae CBS 10118]